MIDKVPSSSAPPIFDNSLYRRKVIRPLSKPIARFLFGIGFSANGVCWVKLILGLCGAAFLASQSSGICLIGMALLQLNFLLDAADGEVARLRGEAGMLSGEFWDKITDHLPKTAMYFFWGYGAFRLTGNHIPLFCGIFFAAWNIYPRFCAVETLLERLDKAPEVYRKRAFIRALKGSFVTEKGRGEADFYLTIFVHPPINLLTLFFIVEVFFNNFRLFDYELTTRVVFIVIYTLVGIVNFARKTFRFYRLLHFS